MPRDIKEIKRWKLNKIQITEEKHAQYKDLNDLNKNVSWEKETTLAMLGDWFGNNYKGRVLQDYN